MTTTGSSEASAAMRYVDVALYAEGDHARASPCGYEEARMLVHDRRSALTAKVEAVVGNGGVAVLTMPYRMGHDAKLGFVDTLLELFPERRVNHRDVGEAEQVLVGERGPVVR